jgi:hypothetical protein
MKKVIKFIIDCDQLADCDYADGLLLKARNALGDLRLKLEPSLITAADVAAYKESKRRATLPRLTYDDDKEFYMLDGKRCPDSWERIFRNMPDKTPKEAHTYLCGIVGNEWNTQAAFRDESLFFEYEGTIRGADYETDQEIREQLEWKAGEPERQRKAAEEREQKELERLASIERAKLEEAAKAEKKRLDEMERRKEQKMKAEMAEDMKRLAPKRSEIMESLREMPELSVGEAWGWVSSEWECCAEYARIICEKGASEDYLWEIKNEEKVIGYKGYVQGIPYEENGVVNGAVDTHLSV